MTTAIIPCPECQVYFCGHPDHRGSDEVELRREVAASLDRHVPDAERWVSEWEGVQE